MAENIAVFIDWQNVYKAARKAFGPDEFGYDEADEDADPYPNAYGNFSPYQLALKLAAGNDRGHDGNLVRVEVHRGLPSSTRDPDGFSANRRQSAAWMKENPEVVFPRLRSLRYNREDDWAPQEKGVDVNLAIGAVESVLTQTCDMAVLFSHDTDLLPAIEAIARIASPRNVETAAWTSPSFDQRLRTKIKGVYHHHLDASVFEAVETRINYSRGAARGG